MEAPGYHQSTVLGKLRAWTQTKTSGLLKNGSTLALPRLIHDVFDAVVVCHRNAMSHLTIINAYWFAVVFSDVSEDDVRVLVLLWRNVLTFNVGVARVLFGEHYS